MSTRSDHRGLHRQPPESNATGFSARALEGGPRPISQAGRGKGGDRLWLHVCRSHRPNHATHASHSCEVAGATPSFPSATGTRLRIGLQAGDRTSFPDRDSSSQVPPRRSKGLMRRASAASAGLLHRPLSLAREREETGRRAQQAVRPRLPPSALADLSRVANRTISHTVVVTVPKATPARAICCPHDGLGVSNQ